MFFVINKKALISTYKETKTMLCGTTLIADQTDDHLAHRHGVLNACPVTGAKPIQITKHMLVRLNCSRMTFTFPPLLPYTKRQLSESLGNATLPVVAFITSRRLIISPFQKMSTEFFKFFCACFFSGKNPRSCIHIFPPLWKTPDIFLPWRWSSCFCCLCAR